MESILKEMLEQLKYQTKLLESISTIMDAGQKHGQVKAEEMKSQTMAMFKGIFGNHPAMQKIMQTNQTKIKG